MSLQVCHILVLSQFQYGIWIMSPFRFSSVIYCRNLTSGCLLSDGDSMIHDCTTVDDRNSASPCRHMHIYICIHMYYTTRLHMVLVYKVYLRSCRISIISSTTLRFQSTQIEGICMVSVSGIVIMVCSIYSILDYLDPLGKCTLLEDAAQK